jgi:hypothetical protein
MECSRFFAQTFAQATPGLHRAKCNSDQTSALTPELTSRIFLAGRRDVRIDCLCRWRLTWKSGSGRHWVVIEAPNGEKIRIAKWIGHHDNNVAEYTALLEALQYALELKAKALRKWWSGR